MNKTIKNNFLYSLLYQVFTLAMPLVTAPYISRVLGAEGVGLYSYHFSVATYFVYFELLGINSYGVRAIASCKNKEDRDQAFSNIYCVQFIWSMAVLTVYVLYILSGLCKNKNIALLFSLYVISGALDINWFFFGTEQFEITTKRNVLIKSCLICFIFLSVKGKSDIALYVTIVSFGYLASQLIMWRYAKGQISIRAAQRERLMTHFKSLMVLFVPVIAVSIYKLMDKIMLGSMTNMAEIGYYENAEKIVSVPSYVTVALASVMLPRMTNLNANDDDKTFNAFFFKSIEMVSLIGIPMAFGLVAISDIFVPIYYGEMFRPSISIMKILSFTLFFNTWASVIRTQYLIPKKRDKMYIKSVLFGAVVNLIINLILIPQMGANGAAIGTVFAEAGVAFYQAFEIQKEVPIWKYLIISNKYIMPALIMYLIIHVLNDQIKMSAIWKMFIIIIMGIAIYGVQIVLLYLIKRRVSKVRLIKSDEGIRQ